MNKATTYRLGAKLAGFFDIGPNTWSWDAGFFQSQFRTVKDGGTSAPAQSAAGISKRFIELPTADHNDLLEVDEPRYRAAVREFLAAVSGSARGG